MAKPTLASYIRNDLQDIGDKADPGPYVTISRQYGCDGYELGELLQKKLNERKLNERKEDKPWRFYRKDMLKQLAEDTGLAEEVIGKESLTKPSLLRDFLRGARRSQIPDGYEIRSVEHLGYDVFAPAHVQQMLPALLMYTGFLQMFPNANSTESALWRELRELGGIYWQKKQERVAGGAG